MKLTKALLRKIIEEETIKELNPRDDYNPKLHGRVFFPYYYAAFKKLNQDKIWVIHCGFGKVYGYQDNGELNEQDLVEYFPQKVPTQTHKHPLRCSRNGFSDDQAAYEQRPGINQINNYLGNETTGLPPFRGSADGKSAWRVYDYQTDDADITSIKIDKDNISAATINSKMAEQQSKNLKRLALGLSSKKSKQRAVSCDFMPNGTYDIVFSNIRGIDGDESFWCIIPAEGKGASVNGANRNVYEQVDFNHYAQIEISNLKYTNTDELDTDELIYKFQPNMYEVDLKAFGDRKKLEDFLQKQKDARRNSEPFPGIIASRSLF